MSKAAAVKQVLEALEDDSMSLTAVRSLFNELVCKIK